MRRAKKHQETILNQPSYYQTQKKQGINKPQQKKKSDRDINPSFYSVLLKGRLTKIGY